MDLYGGFLHNMEKILETKALLEPCYFRKGFDLDENFLDLWDKIKHKTYYRVEFDSEELIKQASKSIEEMPSIYPPRL